MQQGIQPAVVAAISLLTVGLFVPLSIYGGNNNEFASSYLQLLLVYAPYLLSLSLVAGMLGLLMTATGSRRYKAMLSAVAVLVWIQGNILVWDYGSLDGRSIDWLSGSWRGILDLTVWAVVLAIAISAFERFGKVLLVAAVATLFIQVAGSATVLMFGNVQLNRTTNIDVDSSARDAIFRFSGSHNVVHIVMDGFQSDIFANILAEDGKRGVSDELRGFTFFRDHLGAYPYTQLTVPALLSAQLYRNQIPTDEFVRDTLQGETILSAVADAGYQIDVAAPVALANIYGLSDVDNVYGITQHSHVSEQDYIDNDSAKLIDLALFRVVPHFAKALVYRDQLWVFQGTNRNGSFLHLQYFSDLAFLKRLTARMSIDRNAPVYKMIHVMLSHQPTVGNEQCEYDGRRPLNRKNVTIQARCGLFAVLDVLRRMKELGIYDQSLIVLMSDHGAWVPVDTPPDVGAEPTSVNGLTIAMATPVLAIKPPGEQTAFQVSNTPTSIIDVPESIADILNLDAEFEGESVFRLDSTTTRARAHMTYFYGQNPDAKGYLYPMHEYTITGNPFDPASWRHVAQHVASRVVAAETD